MSLRKHTVAIGIAIALLAAAGCGKKKTPVDPVQIGARIDHSSWDRLLKKYVDSQGLVDYAGWKSDASDREALRRYLAQIARIPRPPAQDTEKVASLVNAYNALTIEWILRNYPVRSIQSLKRSFKEPRHEVGGRMVSLDQIEHVTLRPQAGFLTHAALVCAARSCPPLAREAYRAESVDNQLSNSMHRWLMREDLNEFLLGRNQVSISKLFQWYAEDFEKGRGGLRGVLALYCQQQYRGWAAGRTAPKIRYKSYDWGLNDQGSQGRRYGGLKLFWDKIRNR